ncbi:hypothetical protein K469DRAFT_792869 [Zopfia rhizophila CBS 207.26]|uniref:Uncharacterized protein n=1 Tax=Zopfia rhizophila CBS 207.26 TaxID=1314779 RepID=A0A6A6DNF3_9PEZI|nr:hypothetical protein K469DRAFT_792869 [Zopfia rhizophila CBS 207.26]
MGVMVVFSAGVLACGSGIAGLILRVQQRQHFEDVSWWISPLFIATLFKHAAESPSYQSWKGRMRSIFAITHLSSNKSEKSTSGGSGRVPIREAEEIVHKKETEVSVVAARVDYTV